MFAESAFAQTPFAALVPATASVVAGAYADDAPRKKKKRIFPYLETPATASAPRRRRQGQAGERAVPPPVELPADPTADALPPLPLGPLLRNVSPLSQDLGWATMLEERRARTMAEQARAREVERLRLEEERRQRAIASVWLSGATSAVDDDAQAATELMQTAMARADAAMPEIERLLSVYREGRRATENKEIGALLPKILEMIL